MHKISLVVLGAALLAPCAMSQDTLPPGYLTMMGRRDVPYPFDRGVFRYQEVHSTWRSKGATLLKSVEFRRGRLIADNTAAKARTGDIDFSVGYGDVAKFSNTFSTNFSATPTKAFSKTKVSMPDWQKLPKTLTTPWSLKLPFSSNFLYLPKPSGSAPLRDIVWEVVYQKPSLVSPSSYEVDRTNSFTPNGTIRYGDYMQHGTGCTVNGRSMTSLIQFENHGPAGTPNKMVATVILTNNPANTQVTAAVGLTAANATIPGWCAPVRVNPLLFVPIAKSSATGTIPTQTIGIPYLKGLIHTPIWIQSFAADSTQPSGVALSNLAGSTMWPDPGTLDLFKYAYSTTLTATTGSGPFTAGAVITRWQ